jgi:hypothetical protein
LTYKIFEYKETYIAEIPGFGSLVPTQYKVVCNKNGHHSLGFSRLLSALCLFLSITPQFSSRPVGASYGQVLDAAKKASKVVVSIRVSAGFRTQIEEDFGKHFGADVIAFAAQVSSFVVTETDAFGSQLATGNQER